MLNSATELLLTNYFYIVTLVGDFLDGGKKLFYRLSKMFNMPNQEAERLYDIASSRELNEIDTLNKFNQHNRLLKYYELSGKSSPLSPEYEEVTRIKGNVLASLKGTPLEVSKNVPRQVVYNTLISATNAGSVNALFACGLLQCEGIFFDRNFKAGIKKLKNAADWLDIVSLLALIEYEESSRNYNLARLDIAACNTPYESLVKAVISYYDIPQYFGDLSASELLVKAFAAGTLKREQYDAKVSRILNSSVLSFDDKERLIYTASKDLFSTVGNLPLKLGKSGFADMARDCKIKLPFNRNEEKHEIEEWLSRVSSSGTGIRPLCIVSESGYIQGMYANAFADMLRGAHIVRVDIATLTGYDLEPSPGNVFVRNIDEDKFNVFMLSARGELNEQALSVVINFARSNARRQFHISALGVTLDLSGIMIICFSDKRNAGAFKQHFQVMELKELSLEERRESFDKIISARSKTYGLTSATICDEAYLSMRGCSIDQAEKALDAAIRHNSANRKDITITVDMIAPYIKNTQKSAIGFGGDINNVK